MLNDLYRSLYFIDFIALKSAKSKQVPPSVLSDDEQQMYEVLTTWAEDELKFRSEEEGSKKRTEVQVANERMCENIDDLCEKLKRLKEELSDRDPS